jgi:serine/threonine protein kinase
MIVRNKYEILNRIGVGGMGVVYRGRHLTFNEFCAIKIVNDDIAKDANFLQRFRTEAIVMRKLQHANAVSVEDFDYTEDGRPFIVMELVEGKNLGQVIQEEGPLSVPRAIRIARQVAQAIGVAHKLGIVHRDLKPGNIILAVDQHGQEIAKVLDFGIAKLREVPGAARPEMTMTGMVLGTPSYMSPEQFMGKKAGEGIDGRSDIYSLGVVLYQMVTAQLPFGGETPLSLMREHLQGEVPPPHELKPDLHVPVSLSQVILKAMEKSREKRFQSAEDLVAALDQAVGTPTLPWVEALLPMEAATKLLSSAVTPEPERVLVAKEQSSPLYDVELSKTANSPPLVLRRSLGARLLLPLIAVGLATALVAAVGYLKYESVWRERIQAAVAEKLKVASSQTLRQAGIRVLLSDKYDVTLDGNVDTRDDSKMAESLAASVPGVVHVTNRIRVVPAESWESLLNKGVTFLDAGDYPSAIDCFRKALADANNKGAKEQLDRAQRAQQTEQELLRNRQ